MADFNLDNLGEPTGVDPFLPSQPTSYGFGPESGGSVMPKMAPMPDLPPIGAPAKEEDPW